VCTSTENPISLLPPITSPFGTTGPITHNLPGEKRILFLLNHNYHGVRIGVGVGGKYLCEKLGVIPKKGDQWVERKVKYTIVEADKQHIRNVTTTPNLST
jgi:hypothetical protein